jgi:hypothetical protein
MNLQDVKNLAPWDWPEDIGAEFLRVLRDAKAAQPDRLLAAELAGDPVAIDDELAGALTILRSDIESEPLRGQAAIALGPVLELAEMDGFDDPDDLPITEHTFDSIQDTFRRLYVDARVPAGVRRRVLEASVRAPQDWHVGAIRAAFGSGDEEWTLTAVFGMRFVRGFDAQILEALDSENAQVHYQAVCAAGAWGVDAAWPHIAALVRSKEIDKPLLIAAIEAVGWIRPQAALEFLVDFADSNDEDIVEAVREALALADDDDDDEDEPLR